MRLVLTEKESLGSVLCNSVTHSGAYSYFTHKNIWIQTRQHSLVSGSMYSSIVVPEAYHNQLNIHPVTENYNSFGHFISFWHRGKKYSGFDFHNVDFEFDSQPEFWRKKLELEADITKSLLSLTKELKINFNGN